MNKINKLNFILVAFMIMAMTLAAGCGGGGGGSSTSDVPVVPATTVVANDQYTTAQGLVSGSQAKAPSAALSDLSTAITSLNTLSGAADTSVYVAATQIGTVGGTKYDFTTMNTTYGSIESTRLNIQNLLSLAYIYQAQALQNQGSQAPALRAVINRAPSLDIENAFSIMRAVNPNASGITNALNNAQTCLNKGLAIFNVNKTNERMKVVKFAEAMFNITKANIDPNISKADQTTCLETARQLINTDLEAAKTQIAKYPRELALLESLKMKNPIQLEAKAADVYRKIDPALAERVIGEVQEKMNSIPDSETFKSDLNSSLDISKSLSIISNTNNPIEYVKAKCEELDKKMAAAQTGSSITNVNFKIEIVTTIIVMTQNRISEITVSTFNNFQFTMFGTGANQVTINDFKSDVLSSNTGKLTTFMGGDSSLTNNLTKTDSYIVSGLKDQIAGAATSSVFVDSSSSETSVLKALDSAKKSFAQLKYNYDVSAKTLKLIDDTAASYKAMLNDITAEIYFRAECRHELAKLLADRYQITSDEVDIVEAQKLLNIIVYEGEYVGSVKLDYTAAPIFYVSKMFLERVIKMRYYKPTAVTTPTADKGFVEIFHSGDSKFKITAGEKLQLYFNFNQTASSPIKEAKVRIPNLKTATAMGYEASWNLTTPATLEITVNEPGAYDIIVMATAENQTTGMKCFAASVFPKPVAVTANPLKVYGVENASETTVEVVAGVNTLRSKLGIMAWLNRNLLSGETASVEIFRDGALVKKVENLVFNQAVMLDGTSAYMYAYLSDETLKDANGPVYGNYFVKLSVFNNGNVFYSNGFDFKYFKPQVTEGGVTYTEEQIWQMFETAKTGLINGLTANDLNAVMGFIQAEDTVEARVFFKNIMDNVTLSNAFFDLGNAVPSLRSPYYTFNFSNAIFRLNGTFKANNIIDGFSAQTGSAFSSEVPLDLVLVRTGGVMKFKHTFRRQDYSKFAIQSLISKFNVDLKNRTFSQPIYATGVKDLVVKNFNDLAGRVTFPLLANTEVVAPDLNNIPMVISITPDGKKVVNIAEEISIFDTGVTPKSLVFKLFVNFNLVFENENWNIKFVNFTLSAFDLNNDDVKALKDFVAAVEGRRSTTEIETAYLTLKNKYIGTYGFAATHEIMVMLETLHTKYLQVYNADDSEVKKTMNGLFLYMTPADAKSAVPFRTTWNTSEIFIAKDFSNMNGNVVKNVAIAQDADFYYIKVELWEPFAGDMEKCEFNIDLTSFANMNTFEQHLKLNPFNARESHAYGFSSKLGGWSVSGSNEFTGASSYYNMANLTSFQFKIPKATIFRNMLSVDRAELVNWINLNKSIINFNAFYNFESGSGTITPSN